MDWTSPTTALLRFTRAKPQMKAKPSVVLSDDDKNRVVKEFIEIMGRKPDWEEIEVLYEEELKLKKGGYKL